MKRIILSGILAAGICTAGMAGTNIEFGGGAWNADVKGDVKYKTSTNDLTNLGLEKETLPYVYFDVKHPIPVIPNFRLEYTNLSYDGTTTQNIKFGNKTFNTGNINSSLELKTLDGIAYYNVIEKGGLDIDLGIDLKYMEGEMSVENTLKSEKVDIKIIIPNLYGNVRYDFSCGAGVEVEGKYLGYDGAKSYDYSAKLDYKVIKGLRLEAGYKEIGLDIPESFANEYDLSTSFNYTFSGPYAGLSYVF